MTDAHSILDALHEASHRLPGVPAHAEQPAGHQAETHPGRSAQASAAAHRSSRVAHQHSAGRPPRVLVAWQRRIAALFGQEM